MCGYFPEIFGGNVILFINFQQMEELIPLDQSPLPLRNKNPDVGPIALGNMWIFCSPEGFRGIEVDDQLALALSSGPKNGGDAIDILS